MFVGGTAFLYEEIKLGVTMAFLIEAKGKRKTIFPIDVYICKRKTVFPIDVYICKPMWTPGQIRLFGIFTPAILQE